MAEPIAMPPLPVGSTDFNAVHDLLMRKGKDTPTQADVDKFVASGAQVPIADKPDTAPVAEPVATTEPAAKEF